MIYQRIKCQLLALALFEFRILFVDYIEFAFSANNFAINRTLFDRRFNLHVGRIFSLQKLYLTP